MQPKFYADENVPYAIVIALKQRKIDIIAVKDVGLSGKGDLEQLNYAITNNRVLVTHDPDFFELIKKREHYGLIFFTEQKTIGDAVAELEKIALLYSDEDLKNAVLFV